MTGQIRNLFSSSAGDALMNWKRKITYAGSEKFVLPIWSTNGKIWQYRKNNDMDLSTRIVRLISAVIASLASAVFVYIYNTIELHHARINNIINSLPNITNFYTWTSLYGFIVPLFILVIGILCMNIKKASLINLTLSCVGWVFSLAWSLGCILAWKLPYYIPVIDLMWYLHLMGNYVIEDLIRNSIKVMIWSDREGPIYTYTVEIISSVW